MSTNIPTGIDTGPKLNIDGPKVTLAYDPKIGDQAYAAQLPFIRAMTPLQVLVPNIDCSAASIVCLQVVAAAKQPDRAAAFNLAAPLMREHTIAELEERAWALWYAETRLRSMHAAKSGARVDVDLMNEAIAIRTRVLRLLQYHLGEDPNMDAELSDIRRGTGFIDMVSDLTRLAAHLNVHKAEVDRDYRNYRADDEARMRGIAHEVVIALQKDQSNEFVDLRNRAWTRAADCYDAVKTAADFAFRTSPADLAAFPPLRTAVLAITSRRTSEGESSDETVTPAPVNDTPAVTSPVTPIAPAPAGSKVEPPPGFPGGSPLT